MFEELFPDKIVNEFHEHYYYNSGQISWMGIHVLKSPMDLWIYQEILFEIKPDLLIECGTLDGGSALFYAALFDITGKGEIVTIDIDDSPSRPEHKRITYLHGSSISNEIFEKVKAISIEKPTVMVILDSDHHKEHVLKELALYKELVTPGSYLIIEDTNMNNHPVNPDLGPGPMEAVKEFLEANKNFEIDKSREKLLLTYNKNGYLKKIS